MGRPSKYSDDIPEQAERLCKLGYTDANLASYFGVAISTITKWKTEYSAFSDALKSGKDKADADVAQALYLRAMGYSHPDVDIRVINGEVVQTPIIKHYPPDPTSMIFWLKNRQPRLWRDKPPEDTPDSEQPQPTKVLINTVDASKKKDDAND